MRHTETRKRRRVANANGGSREDARRAIKLDGDYVAIFGYAFEWTTSWQGVRASDASACARWVHAHMSPVPPAITPLDALEVELFLLGAGRRAPTHSRVVTLVRALADAGARSPSARPSRRRRPQRRQIAAAQLAAASAELHARGSRDGDRVPLELAIVGLRLRQHPRGTRDVLHCSATLWRGAGLQLGSLDEKISELPGVGPSWYHSPMLRTKKNKARRPIKGRAAGSSARPNGNVVVLTRADVEARADAVALGLGMGRKAAFRMLDQGKLRGTVAEMRLAPLRFLLE